MYSSETIPTDSSPLKGNEKIRKLLVLLVFIMYVLLIFEGSLRKWALPELGRPLLFVRDPFMIAIVATAIAYRVRPKWSPLLSLGFVIACLCVFLGVVQVVGGLPTAVMVYGWRNYFLYFPLALIVPAVFTEHDLNRFLRLTLLVAIPIALLVCVQVRSPASSVINAGRFDSGEEQQDHYNEGFALSNGTVRASSTFTTTLGHGIFSASVVAIALASWLIAPKRRPLRGWKFYASAIAATLCVTLSGSRSPVIMAGLLFAVTLLTASLLGRAAALYRLIGMAIGLTVVGGLVIPMLFPDAVGAAVERWTSSQGELEGRMTDQFWDFVPVMSMVPVQGYGLGIGGNGADKLMAPNSSLSEALNLSEGAWGRHIVELGPLFGSLFIVYRLALTCWLFALGIKAVKKARSALPLLLCSFAAILMFNSNITGNNTLTGYGWLFVGIAFSACQLATSSHNQQKLVERRVLAFQRAARPA